ncbi:MAG: lytic transglycosylase domain-containing protein [Flavobacteriales bacterium]|nr:lytic transglycosylase domain-containing protein [Flavobacteriales bacterium]
MNTTLKTTIAAALGGAATTVVLFSIYSFNQPAGPARDDEGYSDHIRSNYRIYSLPVPESVEFAGEQVPLAQWDIREKLDREILVNTYWHSNTLLAMKRANRWFPVIEPILREEGIPDDFKYLALIESGFTNAVSPSGAEGFWQFLEATGESYGLEINDEVDERYHVEKSTRAACHYLRDAYDRYQSWALAAASYNVGIAGPERQINRQKQSDYWNILWNEETGRYVYRILAMKEIMNNADQYGFVLRPSDLYAPLTYKTVTVDTAITDLASFAAGQQVTYKDIKLYNPWLREAFLRNKSGKTYELKLPDGDGQ